MVEMEQILEAANGTELFGKNEKRAKITYRRLARSVHPDMFLDQSDKDKAQKAFQKLSVLWEAYSRGNGNATAHADPGVKTNIVKTSKREYRVDGEIKADPFFTRLEASYDDGHEKATILIVANPKNEDLAENHIRAIRKITADVDERYKGFYPEIIEVFQHVEGGVSRRGLVQTHHDGLVPFTKILERYPDGISGRDVAWIFRRMLVAVGNAHDVGLVNGGVTMDSLFIQPEDHGVVLNDWQYSVATGETLKAVPQAWKADYREKYLKKEPVTHSLDINLCATVADRLLAADQPKRMRNFFKVCMKERTLTAQVLLREFDLVLKDIYGAPKFHPFTLK